MRQLINGTVISRPAHENEYTKLTVQTQASDGTAGASSIPIPDPAGTDAWVTGSEYQLQLGGSNHVALRGIIVGYERDRGEGAQGRRVHILNVSDANCQFQGRATLAWKRPAETDTARLAAFAATYLPSWIDKTTWVLSGSDVNLPAKDYLKVTDLGMAVAKDLLNAATQKVLFIDGEHLHYHLRTAGHTAGITITDVSPDGVTSFAPGEPTWSPDSLEMRNKIYGVDGDGHTYTGTDATSQGLHDVGGLHHEDVNDYPDIHDAAALATQVAADLLQAAVDRETFALTLHAIPENALALIGTGYLITVTCAILGLTASVRRIASLRATLYTNNPGYWDATLELEQPLRVKAKDKGKAAVPGTTQAMMENKASMGLSAGTSGGWDEEGATFAHVSMADFPQRICGSYLGSNIPWTSSPCGLGAGAWYNRQYEYTIYTFSAPADTNYLGAMVQMMMTPVHHTGGAWVGVTTTDPSTFNPLRQPDLISKVCELDPGGVNPYVWVPRRFFTWGVMNYLVVLPSWQISSGMHLCDDGDFRGAWLLSDGGAYVCPFYPMGYYQGFVSMANGQATAMNGLEKANGSRTTFTLIGWDGKGLPSAWVDGKQISTNRLTYDRGAKTVTLPSAPLVDTDPEFTYSVSLDT